MAKTPSPLAALIVSASRGGVECSLETLFETFDLNGDLQLLEKLMLLSERLHDFSMVLSPPISEGAVSTPRCLRLASPSLSAQMALNELEFPESTRLEMKSSLFFDYQKHAHNPELAPSECRSEAVTHSALKSVAAFLNTHGGILYIGVSDDREILGLSADNRCLGRPSDVDCDVWQLNFQELVRSRFKDGDGIGSYVVVTVIAIEGRAIARVEVAPRSKLSFLKGKETRDTYHLYRRDGNRTLEVPIDLVEEYLYARSSLQPF